MVAHFLPQFRELETNSEAWGQGFTEWSNALRGVPQFHGHKQPRIPLDGNLYTLDDPATLQFQVRTAKEHGIDAFAYYFYFFDDGPVLSEAPRQHLNDPLCDIGFSLTWANENWTRKWDGGDNEVLLRQSYPRDLAERLAHEVSSFFASEKYLLTEDGKPIFSIYRPADIPDTKVFLHRFRDEVRKASGADLYLNYFQAFGNYEHPQEHGFDGAAEFPPHPFPESDLKKLRQMGSYLSLFSTPTEVRKSFQGTFFSYPSYASLYSSSEPVDYEISRATMLEWDNSPRNPTSGHIWTDFSYTSFTSWLVHLLVRREEKISTASTVYINAWNEWAEGTVLEARHDDGYAALESVSKAVRYSRDILASRQELERYSATPAKNDAVAVIHLHTFRPRKKWVTRLETIRAAGLDIVATTTTGSIAKQAMQTGLFDEVFVVENRGRDVRPFIEILPHLRKKGFELALKIHSKESAHNGRYGLDWGRDLLDGYCDASSLKSCLETLRKNSNVGLMFSLDQLQRTSTTEAWIHNQAPYQAVQEQIGILPDRSLRIPPSQFPAGTMFWARLDALRKLEEVPDWWFELEVGGQTSLDGRVEHAIERMIIEIVHDSGAEIRLTPNRFGAVS